MSPTAVSVNYHNDNLYNMYIFSIIVEWSSNMIAILYQSIAGIATDCVLQFKPL